MLSLPGLLGYPNCKGWYVASRNNYDDSLLQDADKLELGSLGGGITKLIHQSWSSETVPVKFRKWSISLRDQHPDWKWFLWTDDDNRELVMKQEPAFLTTYDSFPHVGVQ